MSYKKGIPEMPSLNEAAVIATIFDEAGHYEDAALMDEFIKSASQHSDLEKRAGLWSGIWNRLGGWAKRIFFKEYRELYKKAKEADERIGERIAEVEELWKEARRDFKNYELVAWREKILRLPVYTKDLMVEYEKAFGRLVAFTYKLKEKEEGKGESEGGIGSMTPPGEGGEGKPWGTPEEKKSEPGKPVELDDPWYHSTGVASIMENGQTGELAIEQERFNRSRKWGQIVYVDKDKGLIKYNPRYKGKAAKGLKEALGDDVWQLHTAPAGGWVYLMKKELEEEGEGEVVPETPETPSAPGEPSLPVSVKKPEGLLEKETEELLGKEPKEEELGEPEETLGEPEETLGEPEEAVGEPEEEVGEPEEEVGEPEEEVGEPKPVEVPKGRWVVYLTGPNSGRAGLVKKVFKHRGHWPIPDEGGGAAEKDRLNRLYQEETKRKGFAPRRPVYQYQGPKPSKEEVSAAKDFSLSDLIDEVAQKEELGSRASRIDRILALSEK